MTLINFYFLFFILKRDSNSYDFLLVIMEIKTTFILLTPLYIISEVNLCTYEVDFILLSS